jgi:DNA modification methylase
VFNIPLLDTKRGYAGYNKKYPAKSEFYRRTNVWMDVTEIMRGKVHPTQKAQRVIEIPIEVHTNPGEWVIDPFAGSGATGHAARKLGRKFVLIEKDEEMFNSMVQSLRVNEPKKV